jgi:hypothetical protein
VTWAEYQARIRAEFSRNGYQKSCVHRSDDADKDSLDLYDAILTTASDEKPLQEFLESRPQLVVGELGQLCRWVIPLKSLAGRYVPDFLVARLNSGGLRWTLVELESPRAALFTRAGTARKELAKGLAQIDDWRRWLSDNQDLARRGVHQNGLGLPEIRGNTDGVVIIGRANDRTDRDRERLEQIAWDRRVYVRSYDWLAREAQGRMDLRAKFGGPPCEECDR